MDCKIRSPFRNQKTPLGQIRNPKSEIRNKDQNPNSRKGQNPPAVPTGFGHSLFGLFGFVSDFGFRISDLFPVPIERRSDKTKRQRTRARSAAGFTLLEVLLAISIAIGLLVVVLYFYQQASDLRGQLLQETERVSTARLLMDRITSELRTARGHALFPDSFVGQSDFLQFIKTGLPSRSAWTGAPLGRAVAADSDLKLVSYGMGGVADGTNSAAGGLTRTERPLVQAKAVVSTQVWDDAGSATNSGPALLTAQVQYLRFRYWDGSAWQDSWSASGLPRGIEVSLGAEPLPEGATPDDYPSELYRRVIYLPGAEKDEGDFLLFDPLAEESPSSTEATP